jgi:hypothetical protein
MWPFRYGKLEGGPQSSHGHKIATDADPCACRHGGLPKLGDDLSEKSVMAMSRYRAPQVVLYVNELRRSVRPPPSRSAHGLTWLRKQNKKVTKVGMGPLWGGRNEFRSEA